MSRAKPRTGYCTYMHARDITTTAGAQLTAGLALVARGTPRIMVSARPFAGGTYCSLDLSVSEAACLAGKTYRGQLVFAAGGLHIAIRLDNAAAADLRTALQRLLRAAARSVMTQAAAAQRIAA